MNANTEPRCYNHGFDPAHQHGPHDLGEHGWPAHTWEAGPAYKPGCQHCQKPLENGDRYVCVKDGAMHAACVADLDAALQTEEADRG